VLPVAHIEITAQKAAERAMPEATEETLPEFHQTIAAEGLSKLSQAAMRLFKQVDRRGSKLV
jgi:hypothetical protein